VVPGVPVVPLPLPPPPPHPASAIASAAPRPIVPTKPARRAKRLCLRDKIMSFPSFNENRVTFFTFTFFSVSPLYYKGKCAEAQEADVVSFSAASSPAISLETVSKAFLSPLP